MGARTARSHGARGLLGRLGTAGAGVLAGFVLVGLALSACGVVGARHRADSAAEPVTHSSSTRGQAPAHPAGTRRPSPAVPVAAAPAPPRPVPPAELAQLPEATTFTTVAGATVRPHATSDGRVVRVSRLSPVYAEPGGAAVAAVPARQVGMPTWLPVVAERPGWVQVRLPSRPNGATAWLPADGLRRARTGWSVHVDLSDQQLTVRRDGDLIGQWSVGVGTEQTPTPVGETFLLASFVNAGQSYSPVIFATGAHSDTLDSYGGGPGTVAVHGWPTADGLTGRVSHGCVRVPAAALDTFRLLPLGTPISVVA